MSANADACFDDIESASVHYTSYDTNQQPRQAPNWLTYNWSVLENSTLCVHKRKREKGSVCSIVKQADTAFWLSKAELCDINMRYYHFYFKHERKWDESSFRQLLWTYRLNRARRYSWGWWDDTALQTKDAKFKPWQSDAEHATFPSRRLPTILNFTSVWGRNIFISF